MAVIAMTINAMILNDAIANILGVRFPENQSGYTDYSDVTIFPAVNSATATRHCVM